MARERLSWHPNCYEGKQGPHLTQPMSVQSLQSLGKGGAGLFREPFDPQAPTNGTLLFEFTCSAILMRRPAVSASSRSALSLPNLLTKASHSANATAWSLHLASELNFDLKMSN